MFRLQIYFLIAPLALLSANASAAETEVLQNDAVRIVQKHCAECHSTKDVNGGLNFDKRETLFGTSDSGKPPVVPNNVGASELIRRVTSTDEDLRMPPEGDRLTPAQVELLRQWIIHGAPWPDEKLHEGTAVQSSHWSFQPIVDSLPPKVADSTWPINAIDRFIQARREEAGFATAPDASPTTLIRRTTYDLTGLPPTPQEVKAFVDEVAADGIQPALSALVDDLLSRPTYGERWGRHWMDWVRYADTAGDNSDFPIPQAYLYRNYIIKSFNDDLPYDRFLIEQIAGDLLPAESQEQKNRQVIATGYLAMARRFGSLVERYPWHLTIEDTIDNIGRTTMGLTLSCARCHEHKFDPISTRDYYGLYGFFASTRYPFPGIELFQTQKDFVPLVPAEEAQAVTEQFDAETQKLTQQLEQLLEQCQQQALVNAERELNASIDEQRKMRDELDAMLIKARRAGERLADHLKKIPPVPVAYSVQDAEPVNAQIQIKGEPTRPGASVPRKFLDILGGQTLADEIANNSSGRLQLAEWIASRDNPLTARVIVNRIWQRHFGVGLVASTSDFGLRGTTPTHPELLDWLAAEFMNNGWSIKHLHRVIMNSRTYRLSSLDIAANSNRDPENNFYWRFNRRRLDAESIRDTLLFLSGKLDPTPQTEPYPIPSPAKWEYTQHHPFKDDYPSNKRSVYQMTKRLTAQRYLQTFDGPDPNVCTSNRDQSVTPLQALYFVNDEFVHEQAKHLTDKLLQADSTQIDRTKSAFEMILCRPPDESESDLLKQYVSNVERQLQDGPDHERQALASLVRSLLRLNEFMYVD